MLSFVSLGFILISEWFTLQVNHSNWLVAMEWISFCNFYKIRWFRTQWIRQILRTKCFLEIPFFIRRVQCVYDWLNVRLTPHLPDVRIKIMFIDEHRTDASQHGDYISIQQTMQKRKECRIEQNWWQIDFGHFVQP